MKVSRKGEYGIRALCHLAERRGGGVVQIREIARLESIPWKYLEAILLQMKRAGWVWSRRGVEGGYALARDPREITLAEVIRLLDGPLAPMGSAAELRDLMRRHRRHAGFYEVLMEVRDAAVAILERATLADVVERNLRHRDRPAD